MWRWMLRLGRRGCERGQGGLHLLLSALDFTGAKIELCLQVPAATRITHPHTHAHTHNHAHAMQHTPPAHNTCCDTHSTWSSATFFFAAFCCMRSRSSTVRCAQCYKFTLSDTAFQLPSSCFWKRLLSSRTLRASRCCKHLWQ